MMTTIAAMNTEKCEMLGTLQYSGISFSNSAKSAFSYGIE